MKNTTQSGITERIAVPICNARCVSATPRDKKNKNKKKKEVTTEHEKNKKRVATRTPGKPCRKSDDEDARRTYTFSTRNDNPRQPA